MKTEKEWLEYLHNLEVNRQRALKRRMEDLNRRALFWLLPALLLNYVGIAIYIIWYLNSRGEILNRISREFTVDESFRPQPETPFRTAVLHLGRKDDFTKSPLRDLD